MGIYIALIIVILILGLAFFSNGNIKRNENIFFFIVGVLMILISTLRHQSVGTDTKSYSEIFFYSSQISFEQIFYGFTGVDRGYLFYNKIISYISMNPHFIMFFNSLIITIGVLGFIRRNSSSKMMSTFLYITLYYFCVSLNITRQFIVISIFFYGFEKLKSRKYLRYIILILIASLVHRTALIFLPVIFLFIIKPNYKILINLGILIGLATIVLYLRPEFVLQISSQYSKYEGTSFFEARTVGATVLIWLIQVIMYILSVKQLKKQESIINEEESSFRIFYSSIMVLISVAVGVIGTKIYILSRLVYYFDVFMIILIPEVTKKYIKEKALANYIIYVVMFLYFIYKLSTGGSGVVPYKFLWER